MTDDQKPITAEEEQEIAEGIERALEDPLPANPTPDDLIFITSTGAKIRPEVADENIVNKIFSQFPDPDPPIITIKDGAREYEQENRDDPVYREKRLRALIMQGEAMLRVYILRCATILVLPEGVSEYDDSNDADWIEEYEALGFTLPDSKTARRIEWLRFCIFPRTDDLRKLQKRSQLLSGVTEEDIEEELKRFRDPSGRPITESLAKGLGS